MRDLPELFGPPRHLRFVKAILAKERFDPRDVGFVVEKCGTGFVTLSPAFIAVGIIFAPGKNKARSRSQSRGLPAGPEITSYAARMIASIEETSSLFMRYPIAAPLVRFKERRFEIAVSNSSAI